MLSSAVGVRRDGAQWKIGLLTPRPTHPTRQAPHNSEVHGIAATALRQQKEGQRTACWPHHLSTPGKRNEIKTAAHWYLSTSTSIGILGCPRHAGYGSFFTISANSAGVDALSVVVLTFPRAPRPSMNVAATSSLGALPILQATHWTAAWSAARERPPLSLLCCSLQLRAQSA